MPPRRQKRSKWLVVGGMLIFLLFAAAIVAWDLSRSTGGGPASRTRDAEPPSPRLAPVVDNGKTGNPSSASAREQTSVEDDGQTLWESPTSGQPIDLAYLSPGAQIIVVLRPEALAKHPEGEKVLASLGPLGERPMQFFNAALNNHSGLEQCVVGCLTRSDGSWQTTLVVQFSSGTTAAQYVAQLPGAETKKYNDSSYSVANDWAYYSPPGIDRQRLVIAEEDVVTEIIDLGGSPPPLRRDMERLLVHTDADRHFTLIVAPNYLFSEGETAFTGAMAALRGPLFWFLGDELSAAVLSVHWDQNFFIELLAAPTLDTTTEATARILHERVSQIPEQIENHVVGLDASPFSRRVIARFPAMVRTMAGYTRTGFDKDHATLRCYLPAAAGHNLLLGSELTLSEMLRKSHAMNAATLPANAESVPTLSLHERLRQTASLAFARDTLEAAIAQLAEQTGVTIEIVGADLQTEGITKNQSFGINAQNKPAGDILVEILRLANPDKTAIGPDDVRQRLVYVIAPAADGQPERIRITTRARSTERGDELPAVFVPK